VLTDAQVERYSRQIILHPVGGRGQEALLRAAVVVAGDHAAADTAFVYLAAAGVGRLSRLASTASPDHVNPDVAVDQRPMPSDPSALAALASAHSLVVGVGTVEEIWPVHAACSAARRTLLWGFSTGPQAWIARLGHGAAHACPVCLAVRVGATTEATRLASMTPVTAAWTGTLLASEALKVLLGMPEALADRYLTYDAAAGTVASLPVTPNRSCPACGHRGPRPFQRP